MPALPANPTHRFYNQRTEAQWVGGITGSHRRRLREGTRGHSDPNSKCISVLWASEWCSPCPDEWGSAKVRGANTPTHHEKVLQHSFILSWPVTDLAQSLLPTCAEPKDQSEVTV